MATTYDVVIIGGGQAGLVTGYHLQRRGMDRFVILDANETIGGSWHQYWDSLTLFSSARYSSLDGLPLPGDPDHYPTRTEVIAYLQHYAAHFGLPVISHTRVNAVRRCDAGFAITTQGGEMYRARAVVSATGPFTKPHIPDIRGRDCFAGQQRHSYDYDHPCAFAGQRVVVVGSNNSAVQVGSEVAQVADVSLAVRKKIQFTPTHLFGIDVFWFLHRTGYDMLPLGCRFGLCASSAVYDDGRYQSAVAAGNPDPRPMFTEITRDGVVWADGTHEAIDAIIWATGYRGDNLPYLDSLGALNAEGQPRHHKGISETVDGLFYIGREGLIAPASATLRGVSRDARHIVRHIAQYLA